jgi:cystathionine beta-lyase/cystathionine gamma-synthase
MRIATKIIHHPGAYCEHTGAVSFPIYQVSTFKQEGVGRNKGYDYSRSGNPTRDVLEKYIASLESGKFGFGFSSGMAAISACIMLLKAGDHLIATEGLYGGTYRVLTRVFTNFNVSCSFVDTSNLDAVKAAFRENTKAVFLETPSNPVMRITDIAAIAELAHKRGALVMADNTFMSPWLQRPLEFGADIVIHSATKFLGGHSDLIMGLVAANDETVASRVKFLQNAVGAVPSPFDCWLLMRGMKTLGVRLSYGQASAGKIAQWLLGRPEVEKVLYAGLEGSEGYEVHCRQADGPGAVLSFVLRSGVSAETLVGNLSLWTLAVSLGAVESIVTVPARMTHLVYPRNELERLGITDRLVRLSVGIEDPDDLIADLEAGLKKTTAARGGKT